MSGYDPLRGMVELRHVGSGQARGAYNQIFRRQGLRRRVPFLDWLLDLAEPRTGQRLLDVACGEGQLAARAAERGVVAYGVDLSEAAVESARLFSRHTCLAVGNGERLPYADQSFDRVTSIGSLEHYEDPAQGVREMARVMHADGLALILVPNSFGLRWNVMYAWRHGDVCDDGQPIQRYGTRAQWTALLESNGLRVRRVVGFEGQALCARSLSDIHRLLPHPRRIVWAALGPLIPVNMASMLVFVCSRGA